ncbi:unnamed protein product [Prorocentrum cordatum]|uniref:Uncharacterized protein n=1 Tax=Prorocentrum cordatum TaxID=2364126 RepID=A0ABN9Q2M4_9DINO|nr:unnamed protein product [Polarella glacialis]
MPATLLMSGLSWGKSPAHGEAGAKPGSPGAAEDAADEAKIGCCLFWMAGSSLHRTNMEALAALHTELAECVGLLGAEILEANATSGLILCTPASGLLRFQEHMSAEDAAVRLGQLLCRWAGQGAQAALRLRVAVHTGEVRQLELPGSGRRAFFGPAVEACKNLVLAAEQEATVHLSGEAKGRLRVMSGERMRLSRKGGSYYLEGGAEAHLASAKAATGQSLAEFVAEGFTARPGNAREAVWAVDDSESSVLEMSFAEFKQHLQDHKADVRKFGSGDAKTLRELYGDVVVERDSSLHVEGGVLERHKEIVRIQLLMRGDDCRLRELRIDSQARPDGTLRKRDQKLAMVLKVHEGQRWKDGLQECFEAKFGLGKADQSNCLSVDWDSYRYAEEEKVSPTVPGIKTRYRVHDVTVNVRDKARPELAKLGLPCGDDFSTLRAAGADLAGFAPRAFGELHDEVVRSCQASLEVVDGELLRKVRIVKVWLHADILAADHVLLLGSKIQWGQTDDSIRGRPLAMRTPRGQTWQKAVETMLHKRLGMTPETQLSCIAVDPESHKQSEERGPSRSYPGVQTVYQIDEVTARVVVNEVDAATLHRIGLPDGQNFSFSRWEPAKGPGTGDQTIMHWTWQSTKDMSAPRVLRAPSMTDKASQAWWAEMREKRRHLLVPDMGTALEVLMRGRKMDMRRARRAAREICNPDYTCKDFYEDVTAAFPEMNLYLVGDMTSGRAGEDEYQRTLGAMFCFFWLMRLHLDGPFDCSQAAADEWQRRSAFHRDTEWASLDQLLVNAGLLEESTGTSDMARKRSFLALASKRAKGIRRHSEDRTLAMLVLTAILEGVSKKHGGFRGYKVGEVINDHDAALAYVLEHNPSILPSFAALPKEQQESIKFTQSKMEYNMGWLVQAEAPPGALFRKFRRVVTSGQASPRDLAFYFTHWFTDLAGAEPFPQEGCEKFVLKFPKAVLNQFLLSFSIVQNISIGTECRVYEDYLVWRWDSHKPSLGPAPQGKGAIAKLRLVTMAQGDSAAVLQALERLPAEDREVLIDELSNVDIWNQHWMKGPAILVYYAPALMQKAGKEDPGRALALLAEVFRQARALWPLEERARSWWVSVRVDQLKELSLEGVEHPGGGKVWTVAKLTSREGAVQLVSQCETSKADWAASHRIMNVHRAAIGQ